MEILAALLVLVCLIGILFLAVGAARPRGVAGTALTRLHRYSTPAKSGGFVAGFVGALAINTFAHALGADIGTSGTIGTLFGASFALVPRPFHDGVIAVAGVLGVVGTIIAVFTIPSCAGTSMPLTIIATLVVLLAAVLGSCVGIVSGNFRVTSIIGLFSGLTVVKFLSSPLGISLFELPWYGWAVALAAAAFFGLAAGFAPNFVVAIGALAITATTLGTTTAFGTTCEASSDAGNLALVACFVVVYLIVRSVARAVGVR